MAALWPLPLLLSQRLWACLALTLPDEPHDGPPSAGFDASRVGPSVDQPGALRVFSLDYHHVQAPFEIVLWIMLASLAKLGKADSSASLTNRGLETGWGWREKNLLKFRARNVKCQEFYQMSIRWQIWMQSANSEQMSSPVISVHLYIHYN